MAKTKSTHVYIDTSAFLAVLLGESESKKILAALGKKKICTSSLLVIESERNLIRMVREKIIEEDLYFSAREALETEIDKLIIKEFSLDLCMSSHFPTVKTPRSLDLAHLRTALWFKKQLECNDFLTLDRHQAGCAMELGLKALIQ